ncbi:hypothetical protein CC80DRAFT_488148 [Byssothecium circinans]|uniref:Uncharacterized protein n=1 Tax=Byssothecium circinans TaxID=147558 RepID=A0A6A5UDB0_9PLEO|nr:hypothetical protein CC80DRAFT_488148 [Byssothecium circinans]
MAFNDCDCIREYLARYPSHKVGFVVYRLTYKDDTEWAKFMDHLNAITRKKLERTSDDDLFASIDWSVQDDPSLDGLDTDQVRERFQQWVKDDSAGYDRKAASDVYPRHMACVAVDQSHVDMVLQDISSSDANYRPQAFVQLVSINRREYINDRKRDGYMFPDLRSLFPRIYSLLEAPGWESAYRDCM